VISRESGPAPFETLFQDLNLQAMPVYNFWEQGEETSEHERGNQKLEDMPRYIKLSWIPAPDLPDPDEFAKRQLAGGSPDARTTFTQLSPFGFGSRQTVGTPNNGILWTPPHLQPENFPQNARAIANGYVFAGMLESVVEVKTGSVAPPPMETSAMRTSTCFTARSPGESRSLSSTTRCGGGGAGPTELSGGSWERTSRSLRTTPGGTWSTDSTPSLRTPRELLTWRL
jgi:hypothetical protein